MNCTPQRAFTLVELIITVAILGVLLSIAVPSFGSLIERNQQTSATHELLSALNHARGLAITRRELVSVCAGADSCSLSDNWDQSILTFSDTNRNGQLDAGERLHRAVTIPGQYRWNWSNFRRKTFITFKASGLTDSLNGTYTLCHGRDAKQRVVIGVTGRLRTESPKDNSACS